VAYFSEYPVSVSYSIKHQAKQTF